MRTPLAPASATVVTLKGLAALPEPLTADWDTGVHGVLAPRLLVAVRSWAEKFGAYSVPAVKTSVPQSPGLAAEGNSSNCASPR
jgi:hypothetical protein